MKHERSLFDEPEVEAAADARAEAQARAGKLIDNQAMVAWLKTWGTGKRSTKPQPRR